MRIEKFSKSWVVKLFCRKSSKIHPATSAKQTTGQNSTKNQRKWILTKEMDRGKWILRSWIPDKRFTPEEEEEMHDQFSFILDWILFALSSIGIIIAACTTLADALHNRNKQLKFLNAH